MSTRLTTHSLCNHWEAIHPAVPGLSLLLTLTPFHNHFIQAQIIICEKKQRDVKIPFSAFSEFRSLETSRIYFTLCIIQGYTIMTHFEYHHLDIHYCMTYTLMFILLASSMHLIIKEHKNNLKALCMDFRSL